MTRCRMRTPPRRIRAPVILLGSGRTGTTMLGSIFEQHHDVAYWVEPRPVWMRGHAWRADHVLGAADLTPRIARSIDRRFGRFLERSGRSRFAARMREPEPAEQLEPRPKRLHVPFARPHARPSARMPKCDHHPGPGRSLAELALAGTANRALRRCGKQAGGTASQYPR